MNFQQFGFPKGFWQIFCQKKAGLGKHSYLKYALRPIAKQQENLLAPSHQCHLVIFNYHCQKAKPKVKFH